MDTKQEDVDRETVLGVLSWLSVFYANRMSAWRDALQKCVCFLNPNPPDFTGALLSLLEDLEQIQDQLNSICNKVETQVNQFNSEASPDLMTRHPETDGVPLASKVRSECEDGDGQELLSSTEQTFESDSFTCRDEAEGPEVKGNDGNNISDGISEKKEWIRIGQPDIAGACFIRAPLSSAEAVRCEAADAMSCLMVTGAEELLSRVIRLRAENHDDDLRFPLTLALSFRARYRGSYRTITVKVVDAEGRASYLLPATTKDTYGGKRGSFAEVKVYSLGLFAVVSCLKQEHFTVPRRGVSYKVPTDPRICLNYLPGAFAAPVMVQYTIQPLDAVLLASVKSKSEAYRRVVSTSPILYLTHPSSQTLQRPLTVTLPCPPNPGKRKDTRGQAEEKQRCLPRLGAAPSALDWSCSQQRRMPVPCTQSAKENPTELLSVVTSRDRQWSFLEDVPIRNHQNGLVSFEIAESFDSFLVVRLLSPLQAFQLTSLAEDLVESARHHLVTVVIWWLPDEPRAILVTALPSGELSWELSRQRAKGNGAPLQTSAEIYMQEGDQLLLHLCGNISCAGTQKNHRITFHSQRKNELLLHLTEVDPFGNYSSPHYKGVVDFYKVSRDQVEWRGDTPVRVEVKNLGNPVCTLPLTLPKRVKPAVTPKTKLSERMESTSEPPLVWLSGELSEDELAPLALSLHLRRSAAQLVKLRAGDSLPDRALGLLTVWKRELPASQMQPKISQLARCLARIGRPDLARELLLRQARGTRPLDVE